MKKKIAIISFGLGKGGAEKVSSILANEMSSQGYEVLFLAVYDNTKEYKLLPEVKYKYLSVEQGSKVFKFFMRSRLILREIERYNPDYIISFVIQELWPLFILRKQKIVLSERTDPKSQTNREKMSKRFFFTLADGVVFQTDGAKKCYSKYIERKSKVIANPISNVLPEWNSKSHEGCIVTACRISREKNIEMLLKAFAKFAQKHDNYYLKIYGSIVDEAYYEELKDLSRKKEILKKVEFCGFHKDVQDELVKGEVFVLPSNYEGLSNSMLEALCMGIPTICTDCPSGGAAQYIINDYNGFLVNINDDEQLYKRMTELVDDEIKQVKFANNARKLRSILDQEVITNKWISFIEGEH